MDEDIPIGSIVNINRSEELFILVAYYSTSDYGGRQGYNNACQLRYLYPEDKYNTTYAYKEHVHLASSPFKHLIRQALIRSSE